jgi:putative heme-binding domain-containing protein
MPEGWASVAAKLGQSPRPEARETVMILSVLFGDSQAFDSMRLAVKDRHTPPASRHTFLQALVYTKDPRVVSLLHELIADPVLRGLALRSLAVFDDEATPKAIWRHYSSFTDQEKSDAIHTLASRPAFALALLDAIERKQIPRRDLSAFNIRQMTALRSQEVSERLAKIWGAIRPASKEKESLMAKYKAVLTPDFLKTADPSHGRLVFNRTCASCHRLFGEGGAIGPELTGSQRANLGYILENLLDPSAIVPFDYQVTILETKDGRFLTGIIKKEDDKTVTVQTQNDVVTILKNEIESRERTQLSLMPDGLLDKMTSDEIRDLVAFLASPAQVPLPKVEAKPDKAR